MGRGLPQNQVVPFLVRCAGVHISTGQSPMKSRMIVSSGLSYVRLVGMPNRRSFYIFQKGAVLPSHGHSLCPLFSMDTNDRGGRGPSLGLPGPNSMISSNLVLVRSGRGGVMRFEARPVLWGFPST